MKLSPAVLCLLCSCVSAFGQSAHKSATRVVHGSGCVEKAVENSCRIVIDSQTGELYNLLFSAKAPKPGIAVQFTGTQHKAATNCLQGKPVKVSKWKKEKGIKCPPQAIMAQAGR